MEDLIDKENIADGLVADLSLKTSALGPTAVLSQKKLSRKTRSKSICPGDLGELKAPALKESNGNRRKSAFVPAVKSILSSNDDDEKQRREARRKSLAKRRVSFAPEATLHTWDVVEYIRDATSSSASSDATRRASAVTQASVPESPAPFSDPSEPPSTPPEQVEQFQTGLETSPANQRKQHQKKSRCHSPNTPLLDFSVPDDIRSSSPLGAGDRSPGKADGALHVGEDNLTEQLYPSLDKESFSQTNARLDAALQKVSSQAGTQKLDLENDDDVTMDIAEDDVTTAFKPFVKKGLAIWQDEENIGQSPFSLSGTVKDEDLSMDITQAVGRIFSRQQLSDESSSETDQDMSMELTMPLGSIQAMAQNASVNRGKGTKRKVSMLNSAQGSPAKRPISRRVSLERRRQSECNTAEDVTMDMTTAIGGIRSVAFPNSAGISDVETSYKATIAGSALKADSTENSMSISMDLFENDVLNEDLSMEFTKIVGSGIKPIEGMNAMSGQPSLTTKTLLSPAKTPRETPTKSPARLKKSPAMIRADSTPNAAVFSTSAKSPNKHYLERHLGTPEIIRQKDFEDTEPFPFKQKSPANPTRSNGSVATPPSQRLQRAFIVPDDPLSVVIPRSRRSSLSSFNFSPLHTPREEPTLRSTALLSNNIKLLSTPRKQMLMSPVKRGVTPKKYMASPKQKTPTSTKPPSHKNVVSSKQIVFDEQLHRREEAIVETTTGEDENERISLQEFLDMTKIRFMDLSTTKRRHTAAPTAFLDADVEEKEESLGSFVVAGACTLPEYELYQHACHEMKKYISDGRHFVRTMEANVLEDNPLLFSEYITAPPDQRAIMDNQFKNLKTNARLEARGEWYHWRSTLLQDLKSGLLHTLDDFKHDESMLANQERLVDFVLPSLIEKHGAMSKECQQLQQHHDELNSCDREELEQTRKTIVAIDAQIEEGKQRLAQLQQEHATREARIETIKERMSQCVQETREADCVREECRGWSTSEVNKLRVQVIELERVHGWSIATASPTSITMIHLNDLELYFQPSAFATGINAPNASISLAYVGDSTGQQSRPLTTSKRFFLQLIRAHLHCLPQSETSIASLLSFVKDDWATALAVAEGIRWLRHSHIVDELILSDEHMAITADLLLPCLQTKVRITFEVGVADGRTSGEIKMVVDVRAEVVYGEKYGEEKMGAFLKDFCGTHIRVGSMTVWADAVRELAGRLRKTGRKGERK